MKRIAFAIFILVLSCETVHAQQHAGQVMCQSPSDLSNIESGCPLKFNSTECLYECANSGDSAPQQWTLTRGYQTTVTDAAVTSVSQIIAGCHPPGDTVPTCDHGGWWLAPSVMVISKTTGSFVLQHGYALGDEEITYQVEGGI